MTNEEAIAHLKERNENLVKVAKDENVYDYEKQVIEADCMRSYFEVNEKAIQALEQQPCEDAISREEALKVMCDKCPMYNCVTGCSSYRHIEKMPSVTPSRPKGKWIQWTDDYKDYVTCPSCGYGEEGEVLLKNKTPFCPICGEDLRGEQNE